MSNDTFRDALGPDLDFLADALEPAIRSMAQTGAADVSSRSVGPLKAQQDAIHERGEAERTEKLFASFEMSHPGWRQHEGRMAELAEQLQPNGLSEPAYLDALYTLATRGTEAAPAPASKAAPARSGTTPSAKSGPARPSVREDYEAATRGERWE